MTCHYFLDVSELWVPHARYAIEVILELVGVKGVVAADAKGADIVYSRTRPEHTRHDAIWIKADEITDWNNDSPRIGTYEGMHVIFQRSEPELSSEANVCGADLVYSSYALLTGAFERTQRRDEWGVIICSGSKSFTSGLLERPLVAEYARFLRERWEILGVRDKWIPAWPAGKSYAVVSTHDVDDPFSYTTASYYARRLRRVHVSRGFSTFAISAMGAVRQPLLSVLGRIPDLANDRNLGFDLWREMEQRLRAHSTFYVATRSSAEYATDARDVRYDYNHPLILGALRRAAETGWEVSLHASINARKNESWIREERHRLQSVLGNYDIRGIRHHYWAMDSEIPERTLWKHVEAGFLYDSSFGLNDEIGFRRGMVHPYTPFDPERGREIPILEIPCTLMDGGIFYKPVSLESAATTLDAHVRQVASRNGAVVLDWHIDKFNTERTPGAIEALQKVLFSLASDGSVFWTNGVELAEWWKERRSMLQKS